MKCRPGGSEGGAFSGEEPADDRLRLDEIDPEVHAEPSWLVRRAPRPRCQALECFRGVARGRGVMHDRRREVARAPRDPGLVDGTAAGREGVALEIRERGADAEAELVREGLKAPGLAAAQSNDGKRV